MKKTETNGMYLIDELGMLQQQKEEMVEALVRKFPERAPFSFNQVLYDRQAREAQLEIETINEALDLYFAFLPKRSSTGLPYVQSEIFALAATNNEIDIVRELKKRFLADSEEKIKGMKINPDELIKIFDFDEETIEEVQALTKAIMNVFSTLYRKSEGYVRKYIEQCFDPKSARFYLHGDVLLRIEASNTVYFTPGEIRQYMALEQLPILFKALFDISGVQLYGHQTEIPVEILRLLNVSHLPAHEGIRSLNVDIEKFKRFGLKKGALI